MERKYMSDNRVDADGCPRPGVCHGAAVNWLREAMRKRYETKPKSEEIFEFEKRIVRKKRYATFFCTETTPGNIRIQLEALLDYASITKRAITPGQVVKLMLPAFRFNMKPGSLGVLNAELIDLLAPIKNKSIYGQQAFVRKVTDLIGPDKAELLPRIQGICIHKTFTAKKAEAVVNHMANNKGYYIFCAGSHVMAAARRKNKYYFYDIENGLFKCDDADELFETIRLFRSPYGRPDLINPESLYNKIRGFREENPIKEPHCADWTDADWVCIQALGVK